MKSKPNLKKFKSNYIAYENEIKEFISEYPENHNAKFDLLNFYSRCRNSAKFEALINQYKSIPNFHIQSQIARFFIFAKKDLSTAQTYLKKAISLNNEAPMWLYYFSGNMFNYYEKLCDKLLYTAIPKNASTSLKNFILDKVYNTPEKNPHSQFGNPFFKSHHFTIDEVNYSKKVLVVREPIERIKSYFNKNILEEDSLNFELGKGSNNENFFGLSTRPSFEYFIKHIWDYCLVFNDVLHHILPQSAYIKDLDDYDIVVDIKSLNSMVSEVSEFLELDYSGPAPHKMVPKEKKNKTLSEQDDFLCEIYANDYALLQKFYKSDHNLFTSEVSFNPKISMSRNETEVNFISLLKSFFNKEFSSLEKIKNVNRIPQGSLEKAINTFNEKTTHKSIEVSLDDDFEHSNFEPFTNAVVNKIRQGIISTQDEMVKLNKLILDVDGFKIESDKSIILTPHLFAIPFKYQEKLYFVFFAGFHSQIVSLYNLDDNSYISLNYLIESKQPRVDRVMPSNTAVKNLVKSILSFSHELFQYLNNPSIGRGCLVGIQHIGHSLWNDLTGIQRLEKNNLIRLIRSILVLKGADPYGIVESKFNSSNNLGLVRYSYLQWQEQIANCYFNNLFWIRVTDNLVTDELASKILNEKPKGKVNIDNQLTVTLGLRMENRTWVNQHEGWVELIKHLSGRFNKLTIIIDGHNISKHTGALKSAGETNEHTIVNQEKELVEYLKTHKYSSEVNIISCIESTLVDNLKVVNTSNFFIAPWGAGLAKYRWVCNLPGIVLTSNCNLKSRSDLRIYDSLEYRESSIESVFLNSKFIKDVGNKAALVKSERAHKHNFMVDLQGLIESVDSLIEDLKI